MTLHEAIEKLLLQKGQSMTTQQIADELNLNNWYQKKDGSKIIAYQIHGRTKNYANIFNRNGSIVSLIGQNANKSVTIKKEKHKQPIKVTHVSTNNITLLEKKLLNETNFKTAKCVDNKVSNNAGLYCIRITDINKLPKPFNDLLLDRRHNIIYIGIATESLNKRFLNQELRAKGHGTFFRSLGAILGFRPIQGSLINKSNKHNYTFSPIDEQNIINWINDNLIVNWVDFNGEFETLESELIKKYRPLINIAKNPSAIQLLSDLRQQCIQIANNI